MLFLCDLSSVVDHREIGYVWSEVIVWRIGSPGCYFVVTNLTRTVGFPIHQRCRTSIIQTCTNHTKQKISSTTVMSHLPLLGQTHSNTPSTQQQRQEITFFTHKGRQTCLFQSLIAFPSSLSCLFFVCTSFLSLLWISVLSGEKEAFKPGRGQRHAGPRAWRRRDRGGGRRGRGSLCVGTQCQYMILHLFLSLAVSLLFWFQESIRVDGWEERKGGVCVASIVCRNGLRADGLVNLDIPVVVRI